MYSIIGASRHTVSINTDDNIGIIKTIIHNKTGIPPEVQKLIFKGNQVWYHSEYHAALQMIINQLINVLCLFKVDIFRMMMK